MHALLITLHYSSENNILLSASAQFCLINPLLFIFKGSWSGSSRSRSLLEKAIAAQRKSEDWEIDWRLLTIGEKIAVGSCGDLLVQCYSLKFVYMSDIYPLCFNLSVSDDKVLWGISR